MAESNGRMFLPVTWRDNLNDGWRDKHPSLARSDQIIPHQSCINSIWAHFCRFYTAIITRFNSLADPFCSFLFRMSENSTSHSTWHRLRMEHLNMKMADTDCVTLNSFRSYPLANGLCRLIFLGNKPTLATKVNAKVGPYWPKFDQIDPNWTQDGWF